MLGTSVYVAEHTIFMNLDCAYIVAESAANWVRTLCSADNSRLLVYEVADWVAPQTLKMLKGGLCQ